MPSLPTLPIIYTRHAKSRMRWRRIAAAEVILATTAPDRIEWMAPGRAHCWKTIEQRRLRITVAVEDDRIVVITAMEKT